MAMAWEYGVSVDIMGNATLVHAAHCERGFDRSDADGAVRTVAVELAAARMVTIVGAVGGLLAQARGTRPTAEKANVEVARPRTGRRELLDRTERGKPRRGRQVGAAVLAVRTVLWTIALGRLSRRR